MIGKYQNINGISRNKRCRVCDPFVAFPVWEAEITEDLFEYNISFLPRRDGIERIDWKVSKYQWDFEKQKMPQELYLKKV